MAIDPNKDPRTVQPPDLAILGTLPPLRAISSYCEGLVRGLLEVARVEFLSFADLYPRALYPGAALEDADRPPPTHPGLTIRREISWYKPWSWVRAGLRVRSPVLILQWWSLPLAPIFLVVALVARLRGIRVVTTLHNITPHTGRAFWYRVATRLVLVLSQRAIVHSQRNALQLATELGYPSERILVLPMGAADFRQGRPIDRPASRRRLGLPEGRPILLMFGALREYKGLDVALEAMTAIRESIPEALLLVAGQPWEAETVHREKVRGMGLEDHVRLDLDFIPDEAIHDYFSAADLLLLPYTHFDAQSGVGVSALPYGLPIVVSDCGSLPELVRDPGSVLPPGDAARLAARTVELLDSRPLRERLSSDTLLLARQHDWSTIARELLQAVKATPDHPTPFPD